MEMQYRFLAAAHPPVAINILEGEAAGFKG